MAGAGKKEIPFVDWENHLSPYYTDRHKRFRKVMAGFVTKEILPYINKWEKRGHIPLELYKKAYEYGVYAYRYPKEYGGTPFEGLPHDNFLHWIVYEQLGRAASGGLFSSLYIHSIAIPPIMEFGNEYHKKMFAPAVRGEVIAALAISEDKFGSDVANLGTTARREGDYYIINGNKKWISNGMKASLFVTAVRTGQPGNKGISLLIIPRTEGVKTFRIPTQGHHVSETTLILFTNVKVPVKNLIGKENGGFKMIMYNFNQERFGIACQATSSARVCLEEAMKYARERIVFRKPLVEAQVIRHKIAEMARHILATYNFMEKVAYQLNTDPLGQFDSSVGANVALFKVQATKTLEFCAREASQIFGGKSYVVGQKVERLYRDVRAFAIYGGSEEIMLDVSTRLARL